MTHALTSLVCRAATLGDGSVDSGHEGKAALLADASHIRGTCSFQKAGYDAKCWTLLWSFSATWVLDCDRHCFGGHVLHTVAIGPARGRLDPRRAANWSSFLLPGLLDMPWWSSPECFPTRVSSHDRVSETILVFMKVPSKSGQ